MTETCRNQGRPRLPEGEESFSQKHPVLSPPQRGPVALLVKGGGRRLSNSGSTPSSITDSDI